MSKTIEGVVPLTSLGEDSYLTYVVVYDEEGGIVKFITYISVAGEDEEEARNRAAYVDAVDRKVSAGWTLDKNQKTSYVSLSIRMREEEEDYYIAP